MYLSTLRMVVVADDERSARFTGFDLPLATMYDEKFNQPIFFANNLTGSNPPLDGSGFDADISWCVSFKNGGVGTFLPFYFRLLTEMRRRLSQPQAAAGTPTPPTAEEMQSIVQAAFVDPSDPTRLFVPQAQTR